MRHTFLCQPGLWNASGVYLDPNGKETRASGTTRITHERGRWQVDGVLELRDESDPSEPSRDGTGEQPLRYESACEIEPFPDNGFQTEWRSESPVFGRMKGIYLRLADVLVSTGESSDGRFVLSEWMERIDQDHYVGRGVLLERGERVAAWALHMERSLACRHRGTGRRTRPAA